MKKIRLDLELLDVESFDTTRAGDSAGGTVLGHSYISKEWGPCSEDASMYCQPTDYHWNTCGVSCWYQCFPTGTEPTCEG
jgi:hypothetical protein